MTNSAQLIKQGKINTSNKIDLRELFERVIILETKLDLITETNKKTTHSFRYFVFLIIAIEVLNFALNIILVTWR